MDDLLRHCMRELAFDGDLGCDISRLRHFIEAFYTSQDSPGNQNVDNSFHAFVWSLLVQQPSVRVGLVPQGSTLEVQIAPQPSKTRKVGKKGESSGTGEQIGTRDEDTEEMPGSLQLIDGTDVNSLDALIHQYGNGLRVAVDPETSFVAITGSHTRPAKLSPMVYTALQLISRGRERGLTVVDLGKKTDYDQKACFYLVKQLCELDLVVKIGKGGAGGGNYCVHKYFFTRSAFWEGVRHEEVAGARVEPSEQEGQSKDENPEDTRQRLQFDPIDSRHLASLQLIKSRLSRLLRNSENGLHIYKNLLPTLGFMNPTRRDRKFFFVRLRELIKEGFIEKVVVPRVHGYSETLCIRLVEEGRNSDAGGVVVQPQEFGDDEQEPTASEDKGDTPVFNMTIHRQILRLLEEAGHHGLTLNELSSRLGNFDKRTVELLLSRIERSPPPPHLADLATCNFIENQGRERRLRFYILPGYLSFIEREKIDLAGRTTEYISRDLSHSGDFFSLPQDLFYKDPAALLAFEDGYRDRVTPPKGGGKRKMGRPRKNDTTSKPKRAVAVKDRKTQVKPLGKKKKAANAPVDARGIVQSQEPTKRTDQRGAKRKRSDDAAEGHDAPQPPAKKPRGRQAKKAGAEPKVVSNDTDGGIAGTLIPTKTERQSRSLKQVESKSLDHTGTSDASAGSNSMPPIKQSELEKSTREYNHGSMVSVPSTIVLPREPDKNIAAPDPVTESVAAVVESATNSNFSAMSPGKQTPKLPVVVSQETTKNDDVHSDTISGLPNFAQKTLSANPHISINPSVGSKRRYDTTNDDATSEIPSVKRQKFVRSLPRGLVNISQMRAENEFIHVVEASGGIVNINSKEFMDTHAHVIATMLAADEPTSMPAGTQPDRRTIRKIFEKLEERGRVKILTVTVAPRIGQPRPVKLAYELGVTQPRLDQYLRGLREDIPISYPPAHKKLEEPIDYTRPKRPRARDVFFVQDGILNGRNEENWRRDLDISGLADDAIASKILLEVQTISQLYGFLIGKARRARELHQFTLAHLQGSEISSYVVSKTERIIAFPYYYTDLPLSTYFAIISATKFSTELSALMQTPKGRQTLVKDLSSDMHETLQIGRARSRDKILGLLTILASLKLVTPLCPSTSENPYLTCEPNGNHPIRFDVTSIVGTRHNASSPLYWVFNTIAPIYLYSMTEHQPPPFHRDMFVRTADESMPFWLELQSAFLNQDSTELITSMDSITGPCTCSLEVLRGLRRRQSWISSYVLSWLQKQYLHQWTKPSSGYTPLSDLDGGRESLEKICNVISAPVDAVYDFFTKTHSMLLKETRRIHERERRRREEQEEQNELKDRALLAEKAAEVRRHHEAEWDALVLRVHPAPIPHGSGATLKQLRTRYLQARGSMDSVKWEAAILEAIPGPKSRTRAPVLSKIASSMPRKVLRRVGISRPPLISIIQQKSVRELIERQKERVATFQAVPKKTKKKGKQDTFTGDSDGESKITTGALRRQRFQWTSEYDDLARDASAIIRSRCRTWHRMDWTALDQLFPFLTRNNVRQRIVTLRQEAGGESYLRLLEDKWHELWLEHRGTDVLPDDNPTDPSDFDAIAHVEFLRQYIDKRALRVGISNVDVRHHSGATLTEAVSDFSSRWSVDDKPRPCNKMDVVWTAVGEEHREKAFLGEAFSHARDNFEDSNGADHLSNSLAESGLKMALTTPDEDYDVNNATLFLNGIGKDRIHQATEELLTRGVISSLGHRHGHRKAPGRKFKISSLNDDALGGSFHSDLYSEACAIEDAVEDDAGDWREWSVVATDGDMAAFVDLVSTRKIEFQIDVSGPASHRQHLDWNSKKVDDDQIESTLTIRYGSSILGEDSSTESHPGTSPVSISMDVDDATSVVHDQSGGLTPCRKASQGVITCVACVDSEQDAFLASLDPDSRTLTSNLMDALNKAGWKGMSHESLYGYLDQPQRGAIVDRMTAGSAPQCYWVGYMHPVLVSRRHIREWTVSIPGLSVPQLVFPRRWLSIRGEKLEDVWNAGLRAVVGVLVLRPGISQAELRQRLISVYDRQELNDLLHHLCAEGLISKGMSLENADNQFKDLRGMNDTEERQTCWKLTWNAWYRVNFRD